MEKTAISKLCFINYDTKYDTKNLFIPLTTKFSLRTKPDKNGLCLIYLSITYKQKRIRMPLNLKIAPKKFNKKKGCIIAENNTDRDIQLILDNISAKITEIKTYYRLSQQFLSVDKLAEELKNNVPRGEFISFFSYELEKDKPTISPATYRRYNSIIKNLSEYKNEIYFSEISESFFISYKSFFMCKTDKRNKRVENTYYSNLRVIKKYLRRAIKTGIKIPVDLDTIKCKIIKSKRVDLNPNELKKLYDYYFSIFIQDNEKIPLGIFLFSCFTSLRISDLSKLKREKILTGLLEFNAQKTDKSHRIQVNKKAMEIVRHNSEIFKKKISEQQINRTLKKIADRKNIDKHLTLHVGRHTFATNYLRAGGKVEQLQKILGHSSLKETMIYVHIVEQEKDESMFLLDNLF